MASHAGMGSQDKQETKGGALVTPLASLRIELQSWIVGMDSVSR